MRRRCYLRILKQPARITSRRWQSTNSTFGNISPTLLSRARTIANEHTSLAERLANEYDAKTAKRVGQLSSTSTALQAYDKAISTLNELQALLKSNDKELQELAQDDIEPTRNSIEKAADAVKSSLIPEHPFAHLPCLIEIRPGAGGDEAGLFAGDLLRMYENYCSINGLRTSIMKLDTSDYSSSNNGVGGGMHVQEAVLEVESAGAYGTLRCEAGVHRVQRVPATESKGRTHTSAVSVIVLPSVPSDGKDIGEEKFDDPKSDYFVDPTDVRTDVMRASGAGGQHVNKTESAVRLTHLPTSTVVTIQESRSQMRNREKAWQLLRSRIAQQRREEREEEEARMRRGAGAGKSGREHKVRTYNWGQQRVSDHRSGLDVRNLDEVVQGGEALEKVMESVRAWMAEQEVLALVAEEENKSNAK
jgi:peptide chain release factor 1